jgi:hypothetical protein
MTVSEHQMTNKALIDSGDPVEYAAKPGRRAFFKRTRILPFVELVYRFSETVTQEEPSAFSTADD